MPKGSLIDKKRRQDELLSLLRARSYWTSTELCEHITISHRTLMRDLSELKSSGIPIESERGRGGGIRLNGRWGLGRLQLSSSDVVSLLLALTIAETVRSPILLDNLTSIRNRISSAFPQEQRATIEQLRSRVVIGGQASDPILDSYKPPQALVMPSISEAFLELKKLTIDYSAETEQTTTRTVEPQMLLLNWPVWYLLAWDELRQAVRMFRIDRIHSAKIKSESFRLKSKTLLMEGLENFFTPL